MADLTESQEYCWDQIYIPQSDIDAAWARKADRVYDRIIRNERRHQLGMDAVNVVLIMLVGFAVYRIVGG